RADTPIRRRRRAAAGVHALGVDPQQPSLGRRRPPTADVDACCDAVLDAFAGYAFTSLDPDLARVLLAAGADEIRHAHSMSHRLDPLPLVQPPDWLAVAQLTAAELEKAAAELGEINV